MCTLNEKSIRYAFEAPILEDVREQRTQPILKIVLSDTKRSKDNNNDNNSL